MPGIASEIKQSPTQCLTFVFFKNTNKHAHNSILPKVQKRRVLPASTPRA